MGDWTAQLDKEMSLTGDQEWKRKRWQVTRKTENKEKR